MNKIGYSFLGIGLIGTVLSCLTMNATIRTSAVIALAVFLVIDFTGCLIVSLTEKRDALPRLSETYHVSTQDRRDAVWNQWIQLATLDKKGGRKR